MPQAGLACEGGSARYGREAVELEPDRPALRLFSDGHEGALVRYVELDPEGVAISPERSVDHAAAGNWGSHSAGLSASTNSGSNDVPLYATMIRETN